MTAEATQAGPIAVYGATGFTGRLVAAELRRRGAQMVLSGRNPAKLEILAEEIGGDVDTRPARLDDPATLRDLLEPCAAVISCAGPFRLHGEPVLAAAIEAGTHYLDTTGEQPFMRTVFERYGEDAERAGVALVTAMGFDYVPGDMIASLTAGSGPVEEVVLAYWVKGFGPTRGTALSALGMLAGGDVEWRDGELVAASQRVGRGTWDFGEPIGSQRMVRYPAGEHITVPRHVRTTRVTTVLSASTAVPVPGAAASLVMAPFQLALRTPVRRALEALVPRLPEGPSEESRRKSRFVIECEVRGAGGRTRGTVTGSDPYGLTARTTVEGALRCAATGYERRGALAPSQAFNPADFLDSLGSAGVEYETPRGPR
ncbi:MAG TPA: saccharopine dehydrogenase NADP-binding domain-containing protein [Solirubrobacterales bacterium]|nr:saccharopine dehydrogenase NADP-binding domain-containing protein [Solirubrobacterales bacterium]